MMDIEKVRNFLLVILGAVIFIALIFFTGVLVYHFPYTLLLIMFLILLSLSIFKFTVVKEGTAKIRTKLGSYDGTMLSKKGYIINKEGEIIEGKEKRLLSFLGGVHFVGIRGVHAVHKRTFTWTKALPNGDLENKEEEGVDFILAKVDYQYGMIVDKAEDQQFLPLNIELILTARVVNPYKAVFKVKNWFEAVASRIVPHVREFVSNRDYVAVKTEVLPAKEILDQLKDFIKEVEDEYGVQIRKLEVSKVDPPEEFRNSTLSKFRGERKAEERSGATAGAVMAMLAEYTGSSLKELRDEFKADPETTSKKYEAIIKSNQDFIEQALAAEAGALKSYRFNGASGGLDFVAVLSDLFGKGGSGEDSGGKNKKFKDMTTEERKKKRREMEEEEGN